jgi:hypothetical protein
MKHLILSTFLLCSVAAFGQNEVARIVIAIKNETDTISVEHFDARDNLVFVKSYLFSGGLARIYGWLYNENTKIIRYVYLSKYKKEESFIRDYEYDTLQNVRKGFQYKLKDDIFEKRISLSEINNIKDIEKSAIFKEMIDGDKYVSEITYFTDTLPLKTIRFNENSDTSQIVDYSYNNQNLLTLTIADSKDNNNVYKASYMYDTLKRIIFYEFYSPKNDILRKYDYDTPNIIKMYEKRAKIIFTTIDEYENGRVVKRLEYKDEIEEPRYIIFYKYDKKNRLIFTTSLNYYSTEKNKPFKSTIKYIYITK